MIKAFLNTLLGSALVAEGKPKKQEASRPTPTPTDLMMTKFEQELMGSELQLQKYLVKTSDSECFQQFALEFMQETCGTMNHESLMKWALRWTNCQMAQTKADSVTTCEEGEDISQCVSRLGQKPNAYMTYNTFQLHLKEHCYETQKTGQQQQSARLINSLFSATHKTAVLLQTLQDDTKMNVQEINEAMTQQHNVIQKKLEVLASASSESLKELREASQQLEKDQQGLLQVLKEKSDELKKQMVESLEAQDYLKHAQGEALDRLIQTHSEIDKLKKVQDSVLTNVELATGALQSLKQAHELAVNRSMHVLASIQEQQASLQVEVKLTHTSVTELHQDQVQRFQKSQTTIDTIQSKQEKVHEQLATAQGELQKLAVTQDNTLQTATQSLGQIHRMHEDQGKLAEGFAESFAVLDAIKSSATSLHQSIQDANNKLSTEMSQGFQQVHHQTEGIKQLATEANSELAALLVDQKARLLTAQGSLSDIHNTTENIHKETREEFKQAQNRAEDLKNLALQTNVQMSEHQAQLLAAKLSLNDIQAASGLLNQAQGDLHNQLTSAHDKLKGLHFSQQSSFEEANKHLQSLEAKAVLVDEKVNTVLHDINTGVEKLLAMDYSLMYQMFRTSPLVFYLGAMGLTYAVCSLQWLTSVRFALMGLWGGGLCTEWYVAGAFPAYYAFNAVFRQVLVFLAFSLAMWTLFTYQDYAKKTYNQTRENMLLLNRLVDLVEEATPRKGPRVSEGRRDEGDASNLSSTKFQRQDPTNNDRFCLPTIFSGRGSVPLKTEPNMQTQTSTTESTEELQIEGLPNHTSAEQEEDEDQVEGQQEKSDNDDDEDKDAAKDDEQPGNRRGRRTCATQKKGSAPRAPPYHAKRSKKRTKK